MEVLPIRSKQINRHARRTEEEGGAEADPEDVGPRGQHVRVELAQVGAVHLLLFLGGVVLCVGLYRWAVDRSVDTTMDR